MLEIGHPETRFAVEAVRRAALMARRVQADMVDGSLTKDDRSPVTVADFAVQALVAALLAEASPDDALVGEEDSAALREPANAGVLTKVCAFVRRELPQATEDSVCAWIDRGNAERGSRFWTLDPIDGTKGFLRGEQYAVALALIVYGRVELGALGCPNLRDAAASDIGGPGSLLVARRGAGTWTFPLECEGEARRLHVSTIADSAAARTLRSVESGHTNVDQMGDLLGAMKVGGAPVLMDSQAKYAVLASGTGDLLFRLISPKQPNYRECIWDQAAGSIVVEEAGGKITDLSGNTLDFGRGRKLEGNRGVCASNGFLHDAALAALAGLD